jgi:hypothetical protein
MAARRGAVRSDELGRRGPWTGNDSDGQRVAEDLGRANPELTLHTYAHGIPVNNQDLAFADFGAVNSDSERRYASLTSGHAPTNDNAPGRTDRRRSQNLERETGFEPATLRLGM